MPDLAAFDELRRQLSALERALLKGYTAGETWQPRDSNPYIPGTSENCAWDEAWKLGVAYGNKSGMESVPL
jgi:ribosome modulation factor